MTISDNIRKLRATLPDGVRLVCVSKYHTESEILEAYATGERVFGESRAQELQVKAEHLPKDIQWHFIGHLQRNKAKQVCRYASMIQSVDSWRLLQTINQSTDKLIDILLEVHVATESTKSGLTPDELRCLLQDNDVSQLKNIRVRGLMGMASLTTDTTQIRDEFHALRLLFEEIQNTYFPKDESFDTLSMGMSNDYNIALSEHTTMVRIGSLLFGE